MTTYREAPPPGFDFEAIRRMPETERVERMCEIGDELQRLGRHDNMTRSQEERFNELHFEFKALERFGQLAEIRSLANGNNGGRTVTPRGVAPDRADRRDHVRARQLIDQAHRDGSLSTSAAETVEQLVTAGSSVSRRAASRWVETTGNPAYLRAFASLVADPVRGHLLWDEEERQAFVAVQNYQAEQRAMSLTDANGGYMVPMTLDPMINLTGSGATTSIRQIARVVTTATDSWTGVTSAGATAEWLAEATEAADGAPVLDDEPIPVHKGSCWVPFSYEVGMDAVDFATEISRVMIDAIEVQEAAAFTTGSGSGQPTGFVTALAGTSSEVNAAADDTFAVADVFTLQAALPARFQVKASWQSSLPVVNLMRRFETANGAMQFPELADGRLLNRPLYENSAMDSTVTTTGAVSNYILAYGDWSKFVIVDRIGTTIDLVPVLFGANGRPTGQRGFHAWYRTGSDVIVSNAFRLLDVPSAA